MANSLTSLELCAGAGGQAMGLESAGFDHVGLFENDEAACNTLRLNKPDWRVEEHDLFENFDFSIFRGVDLLAGGLPCPPFSVAGRQLGRGDDRNLFDVGINVADAVQPKAIMFENVKGMLSRSFDGYRSWIEARLSKMGYKTDWRLLNACDFGVPQLRPRLVMVGMKNEFADHFVWPTGSDERNTVADSLVDLMKSRGWTGADAWANGARKVAPTLVGGSKRHGGPDLGPTRARAAWAELGVNGKSIAEKAPDPDFVGMPRLTVRMAARLQGIPDSWGIWGRKTAAYRQVGNAFPPPVAEAVGRQIGAALLSQTKLMKA